MFFSLGLKNAWRNRGHTALGMVSMAIAAVIFLSSTTLSRGYPAGAFFTSRQLLGGDIILLPGKAGLTREDLAAGGYTWRFQRRSLDSPNLAVGFDAAPYSFGTILGFPESGSPVVSADRYREALVSLQDDPAVKSASIRQSLPFLAETRQGETPTYSYGFIDARNIAEDLSAWKMGAVTSGEYLTPEDEGVTGVTCAGWAGLQLPARGSVSLEIPRHVGPTRSGGPSYLDYEDYLGVSMKIKGQASFSEGGGSGLIVFSDPVIFVSPATFSELAGAAGYSDEATFSGITITVKDMSVLEDFTAYLRRAYPDFTVLPVSLLNAAASTRSSVSTGIPMDMRQITQVIAFITAALLSATNLTVLMLSRKNEIGILRAIGATRWNIATMVLTECVWIALLGALAGSLFTQPPILWQLLSNRVGIAVVMEKVGRGTGRAVAFATVAAVVFGFLPVTKALRVTPAQVLRGE